MKTRLKIVHLYPELLKTYGDRGNVVTLRNRAAWRDVSVEVIDIGIADPLPRDADIVFLGGGSDHVQQAVVEDLKARRGELVAAVDAGLLVFAVCGGYQLLGKSYETATGESLEGIGLLDVTTTAGAGRLVGDVIATGCPEVGSLELVGFENHGGRTFLGPRASPLAQVVVGNGNNAEDRSEGTIQGRVMGTYLHGPVLALNPQLADHLLALALGLDEDKTLPSLDDHLENAAHQLKARRIHSRRQSALGLGGLVAAAPVAVAATLILPFLNRSSLWVDEVDSISAAERTIPQLFHLLADRDVVLGAYYFLLHYWISLVGSSVALVRLTSALAALLSVAMTVHLGRRWGGTAVGLIAGMLLAVNPQFLFFARDARPYALTIALALAVTILFVHPGPQLRHKTAYAALATLGVALHLFFVFVVLAHAVASGLKRGDLRKWVVTWLPVAVVAAVIGSLSAHQAFEISWIQRATPLTYLGWWSHSAGGPIVAVLLTGAVGVTAWSRGSGSQEGRVILAWLFIPALTLITVSTVRPIFDGRYVSESLPALALASSWGLVTASRKVANRDTPRWIRWPARHKRAIAAGALTAVMGLSLVAGIKTQTARFDYENLRAGSEHLLDSATASDGVVYLPSTARTAMSYYLSQPDPMDHVPADPTLEPNGSPDASGSFGGTEIPVRSLARTLTGYKRLWVVSYGGTYSPDPGPRPHANRSTYTVAARRVLQRDFRTVSDTEYGDLVISLMKRTRSSTA